MTTLETGRKAETAAAVFLEQKGCRIVDRNWRTRWCEIDIVASRGEVVFFCEVKYRRQNRQGSGLDYITPEKLARMRFACELWIADNRWDGRYELCVVEVSGPKYRVTGAVRDGLS